MYTIHVWDKSKANYNANRFVQKNGTDQFTVKSMDEAFRKMFDISDTKGLCRQVLIDPNGNEVSGDKVFIGVLNVLFKKPSSSEGGF